MSLHATITRSEQTGHWVVSDGGGHRPGCTSPSCTGWRRWEDALTDANERVADARARYARRTA